MSLSTVAAVDIKPATQQSVPHSPILYEEQKSPQVGHALDPVEVAVLHQNPVIGKERWSD